MPRSSRSLSPVSEPSFPSRSKNEILEKAAAAAAAAAAARHQELPSPRGVADLGDATSPAADVMSGNAKKTAAASDDVPRRLAAHAVLNNSRAIQDCAVRFLGDVMNNTLTLVGYSHRMTIHSRDVAMALELFPEVMDGEGSWYHAFSDAMAGGSAQEEGVNKEDQNDDDDDDDDEDWQAGDEDTLADQQSVEDEEMISECILADEKRREEEIDEEFLTDEDEERESAYKEGDEDLHCTSTPAFDAAYPPVGDILHMSDGEFREQLLRPLMERARSCIPFAIGDDSNATTDDDTRADIMDPEIENCHAIDLWKRALYAFLVAKLSSL